MLGTGCDSRRCDEVKSSQARPSRWAQVAKALRIGSEEAENRSWRRSAGRRKGRFPLADRGEEACLLSPELADTFDGGVQSNGWWQMPLSGQPRLRFRA